MYNLGIRMQSFEFISGIVKSNDIIQVSITVLPGDQKKMFSFEAKKIRSFFQTFSVVITEKTEKILIVFRKKSFLQQDPIIASTNIISSQLPQVQDASNGKLQIINIYEPFKRTSNTNVDNNSRRIIGKFDIQFTVEQIKPHYSNIIRHRENKFRNGESYTKISSNYDNENVNYIYN